MRPAVPLLLAVVMLAAVPPTHAASLLPDRLYADLTGVVREGCGGICFAGSEPNFSGTLQTIEADRVVTYDVTGTIDQDCATGAASGTLLFDGTTWDLAWRQVGPALVVQAVDVDANHAFTGAGYYLELPQPVAAAGCAPAYLIRTALVRGPRPGPAR